MSTSATSALVLACLLTTGCAAMRRPIAVSASLGCEAADLATSMYVFGQKTAVEQNGLLAGVQDEPLKFAARKVALAAPIHITAVMVEKDHPTLARTLLYGNAVAKCWLAVRNDRFRR